MFLPLPGIEQFLLRPLRQPVTTATTLSRLALILIRNKMWPVLNAQHGILYRVLVNGYEPSGPIRGGGG
jgi:hypothetical protein